LSEVKKNIGFVPITYFNIDMLTLSFIYFSVHDYV